MCRQDEKALQQTRQQDRNHDKRNRRNYLPDDPRDQKQRQKCRYCRQCRARYWGCHAVRTGNGGAKRIEPLAEARFGMLTDDNGVVDNDTYCHNHPE